MNAQPQSELRDPDEGVRRVLIVDDDASVLGVVAEVLEDDGFDVSTASSGEEAIELLSGDPFALVMTDIRLPGMTGVEVLAHVKSVNQRTNVIMITSHASLESSIESIKHGAYDYLMKPFEDLSLISSAARRAVDSFNLDVERSQLLQSLKLSNQELARVNEVLHGLAIRDGLTDLFNHRYINETLEKEVHEAILDGSDLSLIFVDVDKFKEFNDTFGHHNGDVILRELSALMRENVRKKDIVARWGGEEFVVVSRQTDEKTAAMLAETLRRTVADHVFMKAELSKPIRITISAGVATLRVHKHCAALIEAADAALYHAKNNGRNQVQIAK